MNCYEILEVSQNASPAVIKAAYKSLMQRYHPDKNPGNAEIAAHASRVVQAYELLSDSAKRAAYDLKLKKQSAEDLSVIRNTGRVARRTVVANDLRAAKDTKPYWILWLLIVLIVAFSSFAILLLKNTQSSEFELRGLRQSLEGNQLTQERIQKQMQEQSNRIDEVLDVFQDMPRKELGEGGSDVAATIIPVYISNLQVDLKARSGSSRNAIYVLNIPILGVKVGPSGADKLTNFLLNNKDLVRQKLEEKLVAADYDELMQYDGDEYLKNLVIESIGDTSGTNRDQDHIDGEEASGKHGVVDIMLPRSFSVR